MRISVLLDAANVNFLPVVYAVDSVQLRRRIGGVTELLAGNEDEGANGPVSDSVRLASGQTVSIRAVTRTRARALVDGNPATTDRPQNEAASVDGSFSFTVRFDP